MNAKVSIISERTLLNGFFRVTESLVDLLRPDGTTRRGRWMVFDRGDSVAAIVHNKTTDRIILVKQFRFPAYTKDANGFVLEAVAGSMDLKKDDSALSALVREIKEEIGYQVHRANCQIIGEFFVSPGGSSERIFLFYAKVENSDRTNDGGGLAEENEEVEIVEYSVKELDDLVSKGLIRDAKTLIASQWFLLNRPVL